MAKETTTTRRRVHRGEAELPPPRPGVRHVRVPLLGTIGADDELRRRVDRIFHWPMISLALLVLPLVAIGLWFPPTRGSLLWTFCWVSGGIIWFAFFVEFVVKVTIAECRIEYVKRNWLDVVIILLPMLRPLRATAIVRTSKVFTLRGVGMKFARYVITVIIGLEATDRVLERIGIKKKRVDRPDPETMTRYQLMDEVKKRRRHADKWEQWHEEHKDYLVRAGIDLDRHTLEPPENEEPDGVLSTES
jgi:hypothetical protein